MDVELMSIAIPHASAEARNEQTRQESNLRPQVSGSPECVSKS
jgi:hypothetical protein